MFYIMVFGNLFLSFLVSMLVMYFFSPSIFKILKEIVVDSISVAWGKYIQFAGIVVGISSGVNVYQFNGYIDDDGKAKVLKLVPEKIVLTLYDTIISTLQGLSWMFLLFFVTSLIAYIITDTPRPARLMLAEDEGS